MAMAMKGTVGTSSPAKIEWGGFSTIFNCPKNVYDSYNLLMRHTRNSNNMVYRVH
jgi:hypothetical protein